MQRRNQQNQPFCNHAGAPAIFNRSSRIGRCTSALKAPMPTPVHQTVSKVPYRS